jgi:hypothetical protein
MDTLYVQRLHKLVKFELLVIVTPGVKVFDINPRTVLSKEPILSILIILPKFDVLNSLLKDLSSTLGKFSV